MDTPHGLYDMQTVIRAQVMEKALGRGGKLDKNRLMQMVRMFIVLAFFEQVLDPALKQLPGIPGRIVFWVKRWIKCFYKTASRRRVSRTALRRARISYITEDHKINDLFEGVEWFLNDKLKDEPPAKKDLVIFAREAKSAVVTTGLPENRSTEVTYEQCAIKASLSSEMIELHADKAYKRKNRVISLSAEMEEDDSRDILAMFVKMCDEKYARFRTTLDRKPEVFRSHPSGTWEKTDTEIQRRPETVVLRGTIREDIFKDLNLFMEAEDWYRSRDVPYTRRYLFHGKPGTGKVRKSLLNIIPKKH